MQNVSGEVSIVFSNLERLTGPRHHPDRITDLKLSHYRAGCRVKRTSVYQPRTAENDVILLNGDVTVICVASNMNTQ